MDKPKKLRKVQKTVNGKTTTVTLKPSSIKEAFKYGGAKRKTYGKGGPTEPEKTQSKEEPSKTESSTPASAAPTSPSRSSELGAMTRKEYRQEKRGVKRQNQLERIKSGKQGERVDNVIKAVASGASAVADVAGAVNSTRNALKREKNGGIAKSKYKTGGMVNSNKKVSAAKTATRYLGGKSAEPKGASSKATGRSGGTSKAPKTAVPKAKMGGSMRGKKC